VGQLKKKKKDVKVKGIKIRHKDRWMNKGNCHSKSFFTWWKINRGAIVTSLKKLDGKLIEKYEELEDICYAYFQKLYDATPMFDEALKVKDEILTSSLVKFT